MGLATLHTPLENRSVFTLFEQKKQEYFVLNFVPKLNLTASTGIFIIIKILESSSMSSKTYISGVQGQGKNIIFLKKFVISENYYSRKI